ncbi:cytochrome P450 [Bradyrhizobium sp. AUGA SZCCT0042]|uniref:cytochrome P450 n=1 Tax=Bradyrhizobium sp. AUGA SZCCT0042 TaxID=2807651 RepID=UPI001BA7386D|nr:cytochrome P450 [Bradyrhizobium sp. AUGA SZCCT0042]MBR1301128.1 cytochrome P450 [Bradyrhizobium sp. AUGA SZCCT0042]
MSSRRLDDVIVDPATYADPGKCDEIFKNLRSEEPVRWTEPEGYRPFWIVSKYQDVLEIERQNEKFINWPRLNLVSIEEEERVRAGSGKGSTNPLRMLVNMDEPEHRPHRAIAQSWFMPPNLRKLEDNLASLAKEFVDRIGSLDGSCDFVKDVAVWYPLRVIMQILGVPREDDQKMLAWTKAVTGSHDSEMSGALSGVASRQAAIQEFFQYFGALSAERRKNPTDDLATVIANAKLDGRDIGAFEASSYYFIISTAGHDTTSSTVAGGLLALMQNPTELAKLRNNPDLLPSAIEEILRWVSPVTHFFRTATEDYVLRGKQIKAGQGLMLSYPSANRDEEVFPEPFAFKVDRTPNRHVAFGYGPHLCLGMHLARMEMKALFRELLSRLEHLELDGDPSWIKASLVTGLKRLPIRYRLRQKVA